MKKDKRLKDQPSLKPKYTQLKSKLPSRFSTPWNGFDEYIKQCVRSARKM